MGGIEKALVEEFRQRLPVDVLKRIQQMIIYGSRARGDSREDSDLDLVALVDEISSELEQTLDDTAYNVMWDHDFKPIISLKVFTEKHFNAAESRGISFYRNVRREGVPV